MSDTQNILSEENVDRIIKARVNLLMKEPYFGLLVSRLKLNRNIPPILQKYKTAATDGRNLYFHNEFVENSTDDELLFTLCHEVDHIVYDHVLPHAQRSNRMLKNKADDYVINLEITDARIGTMPKIGCRDDRFRGMTSDEVYDILKEEKDDASDYQGFDVHIELGDVEDEDGETISLDELSAEWRDAVMNAVDQAEAMQKAGNIPGQVLKYVKDLKEPTIDWRQYIEETVPSLIKNDFTFSVESRKSKAASYYLPGMQAEERINIAICIDTSGSISDDEVIDFLSEIQGIMEQYNDFVIKVWCFDTQTYTVHEFTPYNIDEMPEMPIEGRGGTEFECNWDLMKEKEIEPDAFIMFTDGYPFGSWGDEHYVENTIFIITSKVEAPFGITVPYDRAA